MPTHDNVCALDVEKEIQLCVSFRVFLFFLPVRQVSAVNTCVHTIFLILCSLHCSQDNRFNLCGRVQRGNLTSYILFGPGENPPPTNENTARRTTQKTFEYFTLEMKRGGGGGALKPVCYIIFNIFIIIIIIIIIRSTPVISYSHHTEVTGPAHENKHTRPGPIEAENPIQTHKNRPSQLTGSS